MYVHDNETFDQATALSIVTIPDVNAMPDPLVTGFPKSSAPFKREKRYILWKAKKTADSWHNHGFTATTNPNGDGSLARTRWMTSVVVNVQIELNLLLL